MLKKTIQCPTCDNEVPDGMLRCPQCGTFIQDATMGKCVLLSEVKKVPQHGYITGPWDLALGNVANGIIKTRTILLGGAPGSGKSTLLLQVCEAIPGNPPLYVAAEEALEEIQDRHTRLGCTRELRMLNALGNETKPIDAIQMYKPSLVILDSIQGLLGYDDEAHCMLAKGLKVIAVKFKIPVIIISHVNKNDMISGKLAIQHQVDNTCMIYKEGDGEERVVMSTKNRMGPAFQEVRLMMTEKGLIPIEEYDEGEEEDEEEDED